MASKDRSLKWSPSDVEPLWLAMWEVIDNGDQLDDVNEWRQAVAKHRNDSRLIVGARVDQLYRPGHGLGLALRLLLLLPSLKYPKRETLFEDALDKTDQTSSASAGYMKKTLQLGNDNGPKDRTASAFLDGIQILLKEANIDRTTNLLFVDSYDGPDAVFQFRQMLGYRDPTIQPLLGKRHQSLPEHALTETVTELINFIDGTTRSDNERRSRSPGVAQLTTGALFNAQHQIVSQLMQQLKDLGEPRPVLVIPVTGDSNNPVSTAENIVPVTPDLHTLVGWIRHFFNEDGNTTGIVGVRPISENYSMFRAIHELRLAMVRCPAILVFTGIQAAFGKSSAIEHQVADSELVQLLATLTSDPPICSCDDPKLLDRWHENRILLVSDDPILMQIYGDVDILSNYKAAPKPDYLIELCFTLTSDHWLKLPTALELNNAKTISADLQLCDRLGGSPDEPALYLLEALINVRGSGLSYEERSDIEVMPENERVCGYLVALWLNSLRDHDAYDQELCLLQILACSPEGFRRGTLERIIHRLRSRLEPTFPTLQVSGLARKINALLSRFPRLISEHGSDDVRSVDESAHDLELDFASNGTSRGRRNAGRTVHFPLVDIRRGILDWIGDGNLDKRHYHRLNRAICEEAKQQMNIVLRHSDVDRSPSLRVWRRQFSVIYYGLLSLDIDAKSGTLHVDDGPTCSLGIQEEGKQLWIWLYFFAYRRMVERVPAYNLTRYYGADSLKRTLLVDVFDDPAMLWPSGYQSAAGLTEDSRLKVSRSVSDWCLMPEALSLVTCISRELPHIGIEGTHWRALARVCLSLGDSRGVHQVLSRLGKQSLSSGKRTTARDNELTRTKIELDSLMLGRKLDDERARSSVKVLHRHLGEEINALETEITKTRLYLLDIVNGECDTSPEITGISQQFTSPNKIVSFCLENNWTSGEMANIVDCLFRIAEHHGILTMLGEPPIKNVNCEESVLQPGTHDPSIDPIFGYVSSLSVSLMAEALRLAIFRNDPLGSSFFASGNTMRQMIRVTLALEAAVIRSRGESVENRFKMSPFGRLARRQADTLTRHLFRYPREQASNLLIEAEILRLQSIDPATRRSRLLQARALCAEAEPIILGLGQELRLRLRLAMTRAKVHRDLVLANEDNDGRYKSLWEADVRLLEVHPITKRFGYWSKRSAKRSNELNEHNA